MILLKGLLLLAIWVVGLVGWQFCRNSQPRWQMRNPRNHRRL
jgi:hypothetical protein